MAQFIIGEVLSVVSGVARPAAGSAAVSVTDAPIGAESWLGFADLGGERFPLSADGDFRAPSITSQPILCRPTLCAVARRNVALTLKSRPD
jgi:hypothetical protein